MAILILFVCCSWAWAAAAAGVEGADAGATANLTDTGGHGEDVHPLWILPFAVMLAAIAIMPLVAHHWWERNYPYVAMAMALVGLGYYMLVRHDTGPWRKEMKEYLSFIVLLASLFVVSGGIAITVGRRATPTANTVLLLCGAVLANLVGTTGASMLLIRPYLKMNQGHVKAYHVVFFIFLVSNVGGSLTPIGDPPLFLGYLRGIPFWWVLEYCWPVWALVVGILLAAFWLWDWRDHGRQTRKHPDDVGPAVSILGIYNFLFIFLILLAVFQPGIFEPVSGNILSKIWGVLKSREVLMTVAGVASYLVTTHKIHQHNNFSFAPIREVAILFLAIFSTMAPALEYLEHHADKLPLRTPGHYYFATGMLSAMLDNAPTYLAFLQTKLGDLDKQKGEEIDLILDHLSHSRSADPSPRALEGLGGEARLAYEELMQDHAQKVRAGQVNRRDVEIALLVGVPRLNAFILAISLGSVFFGACTYIGNGPNFMVKAIAERSGVKMPTFMGYTLRYALPILIPLYVLVWLIFLARAPG